MLSEPLIFDWTGADLRSGWAINRSTMKPNWANIGQIGVKMKPTLAKVEPRKISNTHLQNSSQICYTSKCSTFSWASRVSLISFSSSIIQFPCNFQLFIALWLYMSISSFFILIGPIASFDYNGLFIMIETAGPHCALSGFVHSLGS